MRIILDIPDELAPAALRILETQEYPDDDGRSEAWIMRDLNLSVEQFVEASHIIESLNDKIEAAIKNPTGAKDMTATVALATNEDVIDLAARIADNWTLCQLFEGTHRAGEAEYMVATTVHACKINLDKEGEAFSWVHPSVHVCSGNGLADNPTAFAMLIREVYVVEDERDGKPILRMTQKLVDVLRGHLAKKGS